MCQRKRHAVSWTSFFVCVCSSHVSYFHQTPKEHQRSSSKWSVPIDFLNSRIFHQTIPVTSSNGLDIHLFEAILDRQGNEKCHLTDVPAHECASFNTTRPPPGKGYLWQKHVPAAKCATVQLDFLASDIPSEPPILVFQSYYSVYLYLVIPSHSLTEKNPRAQTCFTSKRGRSKGHAICNSRLVIEAALTFTCCVSSHVGYNDILICGLAASHANHRSLQVVVMHFFKHLVYNI